MFTESSDFYDLIYSSKDYQREAGLLSNLIRTEHPTGQSILDIACGTGELHRFLRENFAIDGLDLNPTFLDIARAKNPGRDYYRADMADFDLGKKYDIVTCLFSSIGYLKTLPELVAALRCFARHLSERGLVVVEPWLTPDSYYPGKVHLASFEQDDIKICRMNRSEVRGDLSVIHFHYLVGTPESGIQYFDELHEIRMTPIEEMKEAFAAAGLAVRYDPEGLTGRGLYVGRKEDGLIPT